MSDPLNIPAKRPGPARVSVWVAGARPRTLTASVVPVAVGTAVAWARVPHGRGGFTWGAALLALTVAAALQVGVNYANDYSDGIRGTDERRVGPARMVAGGLAAPAAVKRAAMLSFAVAGISGLVLAIWRSPWLILVGAVCIAAAWFYTGGSRPYGYAGFGELSVFAFFGVVATVGTTFVVAGRYFGMSLAASVAVGLLAVALLLANNLRDMESDAEVGKRTLAVRLGAGKTRVVFVASCSVPFALCVVVAGAYAAWTALIALMAVPFALGPVMRVRRGDSGRALLAVLVLTARLQVVFGGLFAVGIVLSR